MGVQAAVRIFMPEQPPGGALPLGGAAPLSFGGGAGESFPAAFPGREGAPSLCPG